MSNIKSKFGSGVAIFLKITKFLKIFKLIKFLKPLLSVLTMFIAMFAYSPLLGWALAVLFIILVFIHEIGHVIALKKLGYKAGLPIFIPFLGAVIFAPKFDERNKEAIVGIGGPILGTIGALLCLIPFFITGHQIWLMGALLGVYVNAFNMIPISPLDGGRITQAVSKHMKWVGIALLLLVTLASKDAGMLIIWILILTDFNIPEKSKLIYAIILLLMMAILGLGFGFYSIKFALWIDLGLGVLFTVMIYVIYDISKRNKKMRVEINEHFKKYPIEEYEITAENTKKLQKVLENTHVEQNKDEREILPTNQRLGWFAAWLGLIIIHIVSIAYLYTMLLNLKK